MKIVKFNGHHLHNARKTSGAELLIFSLKIKIITENSQERSNGVGGKCARLVVLIIKNQKDFNENNSL